MSLPVATEWFDVRRVEPDLLLITEPNVDPLIRANLWLLSGRRRHLLIDTGIGVASLRSVLDAIADRPIIAVVSHSHYDHVGSLHEFDERLIHRDEAVYLENPLFPPTLVASGLDPWVRRAVERAGYPLPDVLLTASPSKGASVTGFAPIVAEPTGVLSEGDVIDLGDRALEVMHLPGHSPGSIGLWDGAARRLFSGDTIYDGPLLDDIPGADAPAYVATMTRLRTMPITTVHGGHDPSFGRDRLLEIIDTFLARHGH